MESTLAAVLGGKIVRYPMNATFLVERKKGPKKHRFLTHKATISAAIPRFSRAVDENKGKVTLSYVYKGVVKALVKE